MASLHRDPRSPKGVWYAAYRLADRRRVFRSTGCRVKSQARLLADSWQVVEREAAQGTLTRARALTIVNETLARAGHTAIERISVASWLENWLAAKKPAVSAASFAIYTQTIREFLGHLGEEGSARALETITELDIQGFIDAIRSSGRSATTINKLRAVLSSPFAKAHKVGRISFNPVAAGTSAEKPDAARKETFSAEQIVALLAVAPADWQGAILFAYSTGARLGDTANLRWSSLDVANGVVTYVEGKTGAQAIIGLHQNFLDWLSERPLSDQPDAPVFPDLAGRLLAGDSGLSASFRKLIAKAGIENRLLRPGKAGGNRVSALSFHSLRHTAASAVFNSAALKEITRRVTQHSAAGVLDRYLHTDLQAIREAVNLIPRLPR